MPRPKSPASAGTRQRLSDAALDLFHLRGYNGTSVQDIVAAAGAPKGTFYNHFASKEDLALNSVARYSAAMGLEMLDEKQGATPLERITNHLRFITGLSDTMGDRGCLLGNFATEIPAHSGVLRDAVDAGFGRWVAALAVAIEQARAAGELHGEEPARELAGFVVSSYEGAAARAKASGDPAAVHEFFAITTARILT
ncbi:TetR/AcrR family transcriptional repressor of nem operon [Micromonospora luteifusca]|uniref:TetR/AcrR family transcriptional repressor of nem operon n=1 Tax=Micromonospora luteifusca TaxID=709860 RepID=A0ABS2M2D5_9ACTN|nr:TetR/AcrR family transcriptional regulator [Micromonospora luteifusca]MBM7494623.1 TetR/AcrR family transcriptional repressor of nem operon [Micromonospora luteifusca]